MSQTLLWTLQFLQPAPLYPLQPLLIPHSICPPLWPVALFNASHTKPLPTWLLPTQMPSNCLLPEVCLSQPPDLTEVKLPQSSPRLLSSLRQGYG